MLSILKSATALTVLCASSMAMAEGTILTLSGGSASSAPQTFTMSALKEMPVTEFETTTIWTEGPQTFAGVSLHTLLEAVDATGVELTATALNDYAITIPYEDAVEDGPIVAYLRNGEEMSVRDKGPLWIIYPFDDNETYKSEEYYSRSIWQLAHIDVVAAQ